ncbi:MAG: phosphate ABC transporter permease PstA [Bdellovibrionales bacterium]
MNSIAWRKNLNQLMKILGLLGLFLSLMVLLVLLGDLALRGASRIDWNFLTQFPSRRASSAGMLSAWVGTLWVMVITAVMTIVVGVSAAIYLEEYAKPSRWTRLIELNILNLSAMPSILYGLLALGIFVHQLKLGPSLLTAGLTLSLLVLPIVIVSSREAFRSLPNNLKEASYALGATQFQTLLSYQLPSALSGILTGVILALSRAIGETAPLITIGALTYIAFLPQGLMDPFTVIPIQLFNWLSRPQPEFHTNAAAAGVVLLTLTLLLNLIAIIIRLRVRRTIKW